MDFTELTGGSVNAPAYVAPSRGRREWDRTDVYDGRSYRDMVGQFDYGLGSKRAEDTAAYTLGQGAGAYYAGTAFERAGDAAVAGRQYAEAAATQGRNQLVYGSADQAAAQRAFGSQLSAADKIAGVQASGVGLEQTIQGQHAYRDWTRAMAGAQGQTEQMARYAGQQQTTAQQLGQQYLAADNSAAMAQLRYGQEQARVQQADAQRSAQGQLTRGLDASMASNLALARSGGNGAAYAQALSRNAEVGHLGAAKMADMNSQAADQGTLLTSQAAAQSGQMLSQEQAQLRQAWLAGQGQAAASWAAAQQAQESIGSRYGQMAGQQAQTYLSAQNFREQEAQGRRNAYAAAAGAAGQAGQGYLSSYGASGDRQKTYLESMTRAGQARQNDAAFWAQQAQQEANNRQAFEAMRYQEFVRSQNQAMSLMNNDLTRAQANQQFQQSGALQAELANAGARERATGAVVGAGATVLGGVVSGGAGVLAAQAAQAAQAKNSTDDDMY